MEDKRLDFLLKSAQTPSLSSDFRIRVWNQWRAGEEFFAPRQLIWIPVVALGALLMSLFFYPQASAAWKLAVQSVPGMPLCVKASACMNAVQTKDWKASFLGIGAEENLVKLMEQKVCQSCRRHLESSTCFCGSCQTTTANH